MIILSAKSLRSRVGMVKLFVFIVQTNFTYQVTGLKIRL
jgi:hypothetical protein